MEEPKCITSCLICESQITPTDNADGTDTGTLISILKNLLLQQNEADVKAENQISEAIRLFCPSCTEILNEWHEIGDSISKLLTRSKVIKYRLIAYILESNVSLPGQLQDSAALQDLLEDFVAVKRAVINEHRPSLQLERLEEIPIDALRNCFGNDGQNDTPADLLEISLGFDHEDYHDDWEAPTFDAAEPVEFQYGDQSDELNRETSSISRHVMTTRKRKRGPTEQCDARAPKVKRIQETDDPSRTNRPKLRNQTSEVHVLQETLSPKADEKRKKRSVVELDNGDILYDGKYTIELHGNKYLCSVCGLQRKGKYNIIEHIREEHIRAGIHRNGKDKQIKRTMVALENGDILYDGHYTIKLYGNKYLCPLCGSQRKEKYSMVEHIREDHIRGKANENRQNRRSVVTLDNGDFLYDGKYTVRLYGNKYLCPLCGLQRKRKHSMTEHILGDHIRGNGSNDITAVGENSFLYLNQYGFTFSKNRYKCTTCGSTEYRRNFLTGHIQVSHVNGQDQTEIPSSSLNANESESVENAENPVWLHAESSESEEESEEDSDGEQEPVTDGTNNPPSGPRRKRFRFVEIAENVFMYADKYRVVFKDGRFKCPKCPCKQRRKFAIMEHIRGKHMKCVVSQKVLPFNRIVTINENEFMYGGKYRITKIKNRYFCSECPMSRPKIQALTDHIRVQHIRNEDKTMDVRKVKGQPKLPSSLLHEEEDVSEAESVDNTEEDPAWQHPESSESEVEHETLHTETENETSEVDALQETSTAEADESGQKRRTIVTLDNGDMLYDGKYTIKLYGKKYLCPLCALQRTNKHGMTEHIFRDHARGNGSNEINAVGENTFLYLSQYGFTFSNNQYKCTTCGVTLDKRPSLIDHIQLRHVDGVEPLAPQTSTIENSQPDGIQLPPEVSETCTVETSQPEVSQLPPYVQPHDICETAKAIESIKCETVKREAVHIQPQYQSSDYNVQQETFNAESDETGECKRTRRTIVVLENGDIFYDGKYTIKLCGKNYLCPVCGLQRNRKYTITEHIRVDHILANVPTTPEITAVGENSFLYLNRYGFSCSDGLYKCTTCGITLSYRHVLFDHIRLSHVNGADEVILVGKGKGQPKVQSNSLEDANEAESVENTEEDPDYHLTDSSDSEAQSEQDSDDDQVEPGTTDTNGPPSGPRTIFKCIPISKNAFLYAGKYRVVLKDGRYKCPKCPSKMKHKLAIMQHIRQKHMKNGVVSQKVRPLNRFVTISENEFMYGGKYRITKMNNRYFCSECPKSRLTLVHAGDHIRAEHIQKKEVPEATHESEGRRGKRKTLSHKLTKIGPNEYLYGGQVRISIADGVYTCGSCGVQTKTLTLMRFHAIQVHIERAGDEFYKSVQTLEDGTLKCGKCDYIGNNWTRMKKHIKKHKQNLKERGSAEIRKCIYSVEVSPNNFDHGGWPYRFVPETGRYNCGSCNWTFAVRRKMIRHIAVWHKNPVETAICDECGKTFANKDLCRQHKIRHRPKSVPCPECGKLFANTDDVGGHMKTHLGEAAKKHVCEFCGKRFQKPHQLDKHRATHTGEAPYSCDTCGFGCRTQRDLKNHQTTEHPKETVRTVPPVDTIDAVVSVEVVDGAIYDTSSV